MSGRSKAARSAFSLVELLVVIGIIAILIAMLIPSLSRAREQANRTRCQNNIRQIGMSLAIYNNDYGDYPVLDATARYAAPEQLGFSPGSFPPAFVAARKSGLLALRRQVSFRLSNLACPDGWASGGDMEYYDDPRIIRSDSVYMDYAYWGWRYQPVQGFEVRYASFRYRQEKGTKIVVTDIVTDLAGISESMNRLLHGGNHGSNHRSAPTLVRRTNGQGQLLAESNAIYASGMNVLFTDYHVDWFPAQKLSQQTDGLCYPPLDRW